MSAPSVAAVGALALSTLACAAAGLAQDRPAPERAAPATVVATRVHSAALFKNGLAFVRREGQVDPAARAIRIERLPMPIHGTFWIAADPARVRLGTAVGRKDEIRDKTPAVTLVELMRANVGRAVVLHLDDKDLVPGTIVAVPEPPLPATDDPTLRGPEPRERHADLVLLKTGGGTAAVPLGRVHYLTTSEGDLAREVERRRQAASLSLDLEVTGSGAARLSSFYLEHGLTWVPSYAIDLSDKEKATLTAKGEVINDAEDLDGATLQFVTGFPNLRFGNVLDPIAVVGTLQDFLRSLRAGPESGQVLGQQVVTANVARAGEWRAEADFFPTSGAPTGGETAEDLFLYEQPGVTLKRGERGLYPLFSVRVPYEHLYEWTIEDTIGENPQPRRPGSPPEEEEIWHSVRLTNDSTVPWTTAAAMTMKGGNLLGQDLLAYTAIGAKTTVRITRAVDIQGEQGEFEVKREPNAATFYNSRYDRVTVKGELRARNHKREAVSLEITKQVQGEVTKNPNEAKVVAIAKGLRQVNPNTRLTWTVRIDAGATADISYEYTLYIRS